jgi:hypothetical protein
MPFGVAKIAFLRRCTLLTTRRRGTLFATRWRGMLFATRRRGMLSTTSWGRMRFRTMRRNMAAADLSVSSMLFVLRSAHRHAGQQDGYRHHQKKCRETFKGSLHISCIDERFP